MLSSQETSYVATGVKIYAIGQFGYQGTKLTSLSDQTNPSVPVSKSYGYDQQGRLVTASATATGSSALAQAFTESYRHGAASWGVDSSVGNLGQVTDGTGTTSYAYLADRVAEQKGAKNYLFQYDHAGRLTSRRPTNTNTSLAEVEGYAYDVEDRLRMAKAGNLREYVDYDPTGLPLFRVTQTLSAGVVTSAVGSWYVGKSATLTAPVSTTCTGVATCAPSATPTVAVHLLMGGTRIATVRAAAGTGMDPIANVLYYHRDYQGSVVGTSLRSGGVDGVTGAGYRYTPYGQLDRATNVTAASDSELGYTNGLRLLWKAGTAPALPQTPGLVLLGARVYHAELKRWLQPDTVDALRYTYTGGDPVNFIDPSGRVMQDPSGTPSTAISNWDFLGSFTTVTVALGISTAPPANNEPADAPVTAADQTPQVKTTEDGVRAEPSAEAGSEGQGAAPESRSVIGAASGAISKAMGAVKEMFESAGRAVVQGLNPVKNSRNEIEATATKEAGERADQLGTKLGAGVAEAVQTGAILVGTSVAGNLVGRAANATQGALLRGQLAAEEVAGASLPQAITGYSRHGLNQAISRDAVGVSTSAILDAIRSPISISGQGGGRFMLTGRDAVVVVNAEGRVVTTWATSSAGIRMVP